MFNHEPRRLKRGLKDLSPLFQTGEKISDSVSAVFKPSQLMQSVSLLCPEAPQESLRLNTWLALSMKTAGYECSLISIEGKKNPEHIPVKQISLSRGQFEEICHSAPRAPRNFGGSVFFFDFDYDDPRCFEKVVPVLDKWILSVKPEQESLAEAYKFIKASIPLSQHLEYFILIHEEASETKGSWLFERFSEMVSRRLGVTLHWLGFMDPRQPGRFDGLMFDHLRLMPPQESIEKRAFAEFLYPSPKAL